jgi:trehalose 6-phosphate phosphatase
MEGSLLRGPALVAAARALLAEDQAALMTDVDGTLAPIVLRPELARVDSRARAALRRLVRRLALVAVVTGRSAAEARRLVGIPGVVYIGNHGIEAIHGRRRWMHPEVGPTLPLLRSTLDELALLLQRDDVRYEIKGRGASLHYRGAPDPAATRAAILAALASLPQAAALHVAEGRQVVELRLPIAANKGTAAACLIRRYGLRAALFIGDDRTDLDAMEALRVARASGVRTLNVAVTSSESPPEVLAAADGVVDGVGEVAALLTALAATADAPPGTDAGGPVVG